MSTHSAAPESPAEILARARARRIEQGLGYAGAVSPAEAWALVQAGAARLIDVRTEEERIAVGYVEGSAHVPWATAPDFALNPAFLAELGALAAKDEVILLLCRSSVRSDRGGELAAAAGFTQVFNVLEGFEGEADAFQRRSTRNGWRFHGLPWVQD